MAELTTITFSDLSIWDVKNYFRQQDTFNESYPLVLFGEFLNKPIIKKTKIDDDNEYRILGVRSYGKGAYINRTVKGNTLKMRTYQIAPKDHLFWCKVDTKNGAFGIIDEKLENGVASSNMTFAEIDKAKANTEYVQLLFTSPKVNQYMDGYVTGTTNRKYIKPNQLLEEIKIPLPPIEEQNRIVAEYNQKIQLAQQQEKEANNLEQEIESYITKKLGVIKPVKNQRESNLYFTNYDELSRWDYWVNSTVPKSEIYKNDVLESVVIGKPQYGANVKGIKKESDTRYIRITDINESGYLNNEFVSPASVDEKYLLKENDFLIARSGNTVGKTLLFKKKYGRAIYAGYLVRYIIDSSKIIPEYLFLFTKSFIFKEWISANQRVSGQPNINGQEFLKSPIVIPPINIQSEIVNKISILKKEIKDLRNEAIKNKENALLNFEQEIFNS